MIKCSDIAKAVEELAPRTLAYEWDNVGLLCGDAEQEVRRVLITLDLDIGVVEEAKQKGAQMIIGHHPIMFNPINRINEQSCEGSMLRELIRNNISYYAAHTNLDIAKGGLNDLLAKKLGLSKVEFLEAVDTAGEGIGRIGVLEKPITAQELALNVKNVLGAEAVRFSGDRNALVQRIAVNSGGGASMTDAALINNADVFITGDFKYSQVRDCVSRKMNIIDVCHYDSEIIVCEIFESIIKSHFGDDIEVIKTTANKNVAELI